MGDIREAIKKVVSYNKGKSLASFSLDYDSPTTQLEPTYFWLLDFMQGIARDGVEKVVDNFTSSPGSGHFAELGARATRMQEEGMKIMGLINNLVRTILNLIYDLKEFEIRTKYYEDAESKDPREKEAGMLALKQIWMDNVDIKKGRGSINQMTYEMGFSTLRDAFMISNTLKEIEKNEIVNDQVKRILIPRLSEFLKWKEQSEVEIRKRYQIEKSYLKTEVASLKLYTSWIKPYLKAAEDLRMKGFEKNPALVNAFNTAMFELVLFGKTGFKFEDAVKTKRLPPSFIKHKLKRKYYSCYFLSLVFTGFPQKVTQQNYGFGGKIEMKFDCYVLNEDELKLVQKEMEKEDIASSFNFMQQSTEQTLEDLKNDIEHFLTEDKVKEEKKKTQDETNPFSALLSLFVMKKSEQAKKKEITDKKEIRKENFVEKEVRKLATTDAKKGLYAIYDVYKKAHGMVSAPEDFDF
ncbi:MAG: hypothetical protein Q7S33_04765 [Nanoarchaeota archaeon]|nr:hypothetical protein [Nanoarchaeota archaeon]